MDMKTKTAVVVITALAVLLGGMYGLAASESDESGPLTATNSDLMVLQDGDPVLKERFDVPDVFTVMLSGMGSTEMEDGVLCISSEGVSAVVVQYIASFEWSEQCRHMIRIEAWTEEMCDIAVTEDGKDVTDAVLNRWVEPGTSQGRASYRVTMELDCSEDQAVDVSGLIDVCYGDLSGQAFGYRIVGQDGNGLITGTLEMGYEGADDSYLISWTYGMSDGANASSEGSGSFTTPRDEPWSEGYPSGMLWIDTLWGPRIADCSFLYRDDGLVSCYVADGILYEAAFDRGETLIILQLVGSDLLGESTSRSSVWSYSMAMTGSALVDGTGSDVEGRVTVEHLDYTSMYVLTEEAMTATAGDMTLWDYDDILWSTGHSIGDLGSFQRTETIDTVWGEAVVEVFQSVYVGGEMTYYIYNGALPLLIETSWDGLDGSRLTVVHTTDTILIDGEPCGSLDEVGSSAGAR